jgi:hypothetical protein
MVIISTKGLEMKKAYLQFGEYPGPYLTVEAEDVKISPLWWQERGLSYTASGYGKRIPTTYMVKWRNKWRRVYCCIYSNIGKLYIGRLGSDFCPIVICDD